MCALQRPTCGAVIELAVRPQQRVVAGRALRGREARRDVIRYRATERRGALPGRQVAAVAVCVRYRESIVVPHVAVGAGRDFTGGRILVRTRQRPARGAVIERRRGPHSRGMARRAVRRCEGCAGRRVRRIIGRLPGGQVAARISAVRRQGRQAVVVVDVARSAGRHLAAVGHQRVRVRQRKARGRVVKGRIRPQNRVMAGRALRGREARRDVIWYGAAQRLRAQPGRLVAAVAVRVRGGEGVVVAHVAIGAGRDFTGGRILVRTRQRPARGAVIEGGGGPGDGTVARRAVRRCEGCAGRRVRRIIGRLPGGQMAARVAAVRRRDGQAVVVVDVAGSAGWHLAAVGYQLVRVRQRETRRCVVEGRRPRRRVVAGRAL